MNPRTIRQLHVYFSVSYSLTLSSIELCSSCNHRCIHFNISMAVTSVGKQPAAGRCYYRILLILNSVVIPQAQSSMLQASLI